MTFKDLQIGNTFRDVPSEFGETFMLVMDRDFRRRCPECGGEICGEERIFDSETGVLVHKCNDPECGWIESDYQVIDRLAAENARLKAMYAEMKKANDDLAAAVFNQKGTSNA